MHFLARFFSWEFSPLDFSPFQYKTLAKYFKLNVEHLLKNASKYVPTFNSIEKQYAISRSKTNAKCKEDRKIEQCNKFQS